MRFRPALAPIAALLLVVACSTVPYSERRRFLPMFESSEKKMGVEAFAEITSQATLSSDPKWTSMVERCGRKVAEVADRDLKDGNRDPFDWEFKVIHDDKTVNAFCLPGGKVAFYTGILPLCQTEEGVAVVMGHEVGHALARHGGERVSQSTMLAIGGAVLVAAVGGKSETSQSLVLAAWGIGTNLVIALPFSRKHESEADHIGIMLMSQAGYDPREAPRFWQRMMDASDKQPPEWVSTHPSHERRVQDLEDLVPEALDYYNKATNKGIKIPKRILKSG